jgi:hypothetical protein
MKPLVKLRGWITWAIGIRCRNRFYWWVRIGKVRIHWC